MKGFLNPIHDIVKDNNEKLTGINEEVYMF